MFCVKCGSPMLGDNYPYNCSACPHVAYNNPTPVASLIVPAMGKDGFRIGALITKRKIAPFIGQWCLPGGHVEGIETIEEAGARELREETGFVVHPEDIRLTHSFNTKNNRVLVFGEANFRKVISAAEIANFQETDEVSEVAVFDPANPDEYDICFSSHKDALMMHRPHFGYSGM